MHQVLIAALRTVLEAYEAAETETTELGLSRPEIHIVYFGSTHGVKEGDGRQMDSPITNVLLSLRAAAELAPRELPDGEEPSDHMQV